MERASIVAIGIVLVAILSAWAAPPQPGPAGGEKAGVSQAEVPQYTSVRRLPKSITLATLSNGLTVIVQENHVAPVATVRCFVKNTGGAFEGVHLGAGLSHVLEHVVAGGTTSRHSEKEIERIIDRFGGATNAFTSSAMTAFFIDCPASDVITCVDLIGDSMQRITFEPSEFARELKVVRRELADGEVDRRRVQWKLLNQTVYTEHPVRHPTIGYLDVLNQTTNQTIIDFYHHRYIPNNQVMVVVGDVRTQAILDAVARNWTGTPRGTSTFVPMPDEPQQIAPREATREMDGSTYDLAIAWPTVKLSDEDLYPLDVAAYILAQGDSSRLVRRLKYDEQLVLSVSSASYTPHFVHGWFGVFAVAGEDTWQRASKEIVEEVYRLREELVSAAELEKAKKQKAAELIFGQQTVQQAADSLGRNFISTGDPLFEEFYAEKIQQVTAEQVRRAARKYFLPERLNRVVLAPLGGLAKTAEKAGGQVEGKVRAVKLSNGLRVLIKRHAQLPLVNIQAYVLGSCLADSPQTAGRSALVGAMLDKGTAAHTAAEIAQYFDSIGGKFSTTAGRNTIFASATVLEDDFPRAAALLAECFTRPTFPEAEFAKAKTLALGAIARRADDPRQEAFELFYDSLPEGSPYHINQGGKKETIERLSAEDLRVYHRRYFVPNNMLVTVFGDIDTDAALELVKKNFGQLEGDADFRPVELDRDNAIAKTIRRHKQTAKPTGMVILGYPGTSVRQKEDHAAMTVLDAIMSGYSYPGGWLHNELRGEGLVYYVHAFELSGPAPGYFVVLSQTDPAKVKEVVKRIEANIARAKAGKITPEEFGIALDMIVSLHAQEKTTAAAQAQQAALDELYGLGYNYDKAFEERIRAVRLEDVVRVANKYLNHFVLVTTSPEKD